MARTAFSISLSWKVSNSVITSLPAQTPNSRVKIKAAIYCFSTVNLYSMPCFSWLQFSVFLCCSWQLTLIYFGPCNYKIALRVQSTHLFTLNKLIAIVSMLSALFIMFRVVSQKQTKPYIGFYYQLMGKTENQWHLDVINLTLKITHPC